MTRVKRGKTVHRRHLRAKKAAKGYRGLRRNTTKWVKNALMKAGKHAYAHRRTKKRDFRRLWIARINAACRPLGTSYSRLIDAMTKKDMAINRKMLSELAIHEPEVFKKVVEQAMK